MDKSINKVIMLRKANQDDCKCIFDWRNNEFSRKMSFEGNQIRYEDHLSWFKKSLKNSNKVLYIGEIFGKKVGVCRFDYDPKINNADISININPIMRGMGNGKEFLSIAIDKYLELRETNLSACIKEINLASKKIFLYAGFKIISEENNVIYLKRSINNLVYKIVDKSDAEILYELLKKRTHIISHKVLPSFENHYHFVVNNPYLYWFLIYKTKKVIGTFYIKEDNSIGLNLLNPDRKYTLEILEYIRFNFSPKKEEKSKVPPYFFINIATSNKVMMEIIQNSGCKPIQTSFKL